MSGQPTRPLYHRDTPCCNSTLPAHGDGGSWLQSHVVAVPSQLLGRCFDPKEQTAPGYLRKPRLSFAVPTPVYADVRPFQSSERPLALAPSLWSIH
eukprot:scaffold2926_cov399-Prasinococcus_capsulatus_cf.AAC.23